MKSFWISILVSLGTALMSLAPTARAQQNNSDSIETIDLSEIAAAMDAAQNSPGLIGDGLGTAGSATGHLVVSGGASSGGGIILEDDLTIDDIGTASRAIPRPQTPTPSYGGSTNTVPSGSECTEVFGFATSSCQSSLSLPAPKPANSGWKNPGEGPCHYSLRTSGSSNTQACFEYAEREVAKTCPARSSGMRSRQCTEKVMERIYAKFR